MFGPGRVRDTPDHVNDPLSVSLAGSIFEAILTLGLGGPRMLTSDGLLIWFQQCNVPESSRATINQVRSAAPSRRVRGGRSNVSGRYPSRKMGMTVQFESHRVELAGIYEMEHDAGVLEYYDQPPPIKLDYESAAGKNLGVVHTPDFFVIRDAEAGWEEWKTEEDLQRLSEHNPNRYCPGQDGRWCCPPGCTGGAAATSGR